LVLAWPWAVLKVLILGLGLEFSSLGLGLGLMTCGLINITGNSIANVNVSSRLHQSTFAEVSKKVDYPRTLCAYAHYPIER